ncbi:hypothetical protein C0J52_08397 [Blattella germanica]|nr:hypothetical protein C0J52_08397 [Blattella germanica]
MASGKSVFSELPTARIRKMLFSVLEEENFNSNEVICKINEIVAGKWLSSIFFVDVYDSHKHLSLYLKCLPISGKSKQAASKRSFQNEVAFYTKVVPEFDTFQQEKLPLEKCFPVPIPRCFRAEVDGANDVIILEDLSKLDYIVKDRLEGMSIPEISLTLKELGRFHAFSLAMKNQCPEKFKETKMHVIESIFSEPDFGEVFRYIFSNCWLDVHNFLKEYYEEHNMYLKKVEKFMTIAPDLMALQAKGDPLNEPYNAIIHGDPWVLNFMFHYKDGCEEPDDMRMLDFQQVRYTSPALDVGRMLFITMDKATRDKQRDKMLLCYYQGLSQTLLKLGSNPELLFPFSQLEIQLKKYSAYFVTSSLLTLIHSLAEYEGGEQGFDGDSVKGYLKSVRKAQQNMTLKCRQRVIEIIEEFVDLGYLDMND